MLRWIALLLLTTALGFAAACEGGDNNDGGAEPDGVTSPVATQNGGSAGAGSATLNIASNSAAVGADASVDLQVLGFSAPGLGAWTVDIAYDPDVVSVKDCAPLEGSVCNPKYDDRTVRIAGAAALGLGGDSVLATLTFTCSAAGSSSLTLGVDVLADATIGDPQNVSAALEHGEITCTA